MTHRRARMAPPAKRAADLAASFQAKQEKDLAERLKRAREARWAPHRAALGAAPGRARRRRRNALARASYASQPDHWRGVCDCGEVKSPHAEACERCEGFQRGRRPRT